MVLLSRLRRAWLVLIGREPAVERTRSDRMARLMESRLREIEDDRPPVGYDPRLEGGRWTR